MNAILKRIADFIRALVNNGGPSVVRFVFWATATTITLSWVALVTAVIVGYFHFGHADGTLCTLVGGVAVTLTGFASYAANTKTVVDAQAASSTPSKADIGVVSSQVESKGTSHDDSPQDHNGAS